jgi:hypothetical protein
VLNIVVKYEAYFILDKYSTYHQIYVALEDIYKTAFVTNWWAFIWKVMPFGILNGPPTYQRGTTKTFKKYLDSFIEIFLDDFIVYIDMESHLQKLKLCF